MNIREFFTTNSWWGKILGAFFGYLTAGPMGAMLGIVLGNFFDRGLVSHFTNPHFIYHAEKRKMVQKIYFEATFSVMGHIAKADGRVSQNEIQMAKLLMDQMQLNSEQKKLARQLYNEGKQSYFQLDTILVQLQNACKDNKELLMLFLDIQYKAAQVDGLSTKKIQTLDLIFSRLGFAPLNQQYKFYEDFNYTAYHHFQEYQQQQRRHNEQAQQERAYHYSYYNPKNATSSLDHAYALMEVKPGASKQEVKQAYRRLLSRHHPDKLIAQGLPEEMIKVANDKTQKIVKAYELICENRGW